MPNNTANIISVSGYNKDILAFLAKAKGDESPLDFNNFVPMPDDIKNVTSPVRIMTDDEIKKRWADFNKLPEDSVEKKLFNKPFGIGITQEKFEKLTRKYGPEIDPISWAKANWGTKWNAYNVSSDWVFTNDGKTSDKFKADEASIYFHTAWSPAIPFWVKVSEQYPYLVFNNKYADEGGFFVGFSVIYHGKVKSKNEYDWKCSEGIELRMELGYYHEET